MLYLIRDIAIGIGMYLAVIVGGYLCLAIPALFTNRQSGYGILAAYAVPFLVAGLLFVATSVALFRLPTILASMNK